MNASIVTEYPVIIERIDCDRFVSGAGERKMTIQLKNISQKSYNSLQLVYTDHGIFKFKVLEKISAIAPGSVRSETLTVSVPGNITSYKEGALNVSLVHGNERFASRDVPLVAVPAFTRRTDSGGLLIFHGPLREPALVVMAAIESLGMDFDIYDLNANAAPQAEIFAGYRGKVIGLVNFGGELPSLREHLNDFVQKKGGILSINANPEIRPVYHPHGCLNRNESFFALALLNKKSKPGPMC